MTTLTAPPDPPLRSEGRAAFSSKMEAFLLWLVLFVSQLLTLVDQLNAALAAAIDAAASAMNAPAVNGHSTTNVTVGTGTKTFFVETGKSFRANMYVLAAATGATGVWMHGQVASYNAATGELAIAVGKTLGSGSFTDWNIGPSAPVVLSPAASAADVRAGNSVEAMLTPKSLIDAVAWVTVPYASTIALDLTAGVNFKTTLTGPAVLNVTGGRPGQSFTLEVRQDGTGNRALAYAAALRFFGVVPQLSTTANAVDKFTGIVNDDLTVTMGFGKGEVAG